MDSCLKEEDLQFSPGQTHKVNHGAAKIVSETSILSEIAPGCRTSVVFGAVQKKDEIRLHGQNYKIMEGMVLYVRAAGRIVKHHGMVRHVTALWLNQENGGMHITALPSAYPNVPLWWKDFVLATEQGAVVLNAQGAKEFGPENCFFPCYEEITEEIPKGKSVMGFKEPNPTFLRFWLWKGWCIPFDKQGNLLIRVQAVVVIKKRTGFALLEFPCRVSEMTEREYPLDVAIKKEKQSISFFADQRRLLAIPKADYLRILKPGWRWSWHYLKSRWSKNR
jgi:hypothetical protein